MKAGSLVAISLKILLTASTSTTKTAP